MTVATLTSKGQVTIPKGVRSILGVKTGDRIDFIINVDGSVSVKQSLSLDDVQDCLRLKKVTVEQMDLRWFYKRSNQMTGSIRMSSYDF